MPPRTVYPKWPEAVRFTDAALESVRRVPGVRSAAIAVHHPLRAGWTSQTEIVGRPPSGGPIDEVRIRPVSRIFRDRRRAREEGTRHHRTRSWPKRPGSSW